MAKEPISKSEFAVRRGVSASRVSQWIGEGKISGAALVGEGRSARIDEDLACQQLDERLDIDQREANGARTSFALALPPDQQTGLEIGRIIARTTDGVMPQLAAAVATKYSHPPREVLATLRAAWRTIALARQIEAGVPPSLSYERRS
jgi:hypothetical protein